METEMAKVRDHAPYRLTRKLLLTAASVAALLSMSLGSATPSEARGATAKSTSTQASATTERKFRLNFGPKAPKIPRRAEVAGNADDIRINVKNAGGAESYVSAGYSVTWNACSNYFDTLIKMQNQTGFAGDFVTAAGTATSSMVALRKNAADAAKSLARIAAGASFVTTVLSSYDDRALMTPYPSETKSLILAALQAYEKSAPPDSATTYSQAAMLVERHAELCTYSGITRFAKQALALAQIESDEQTAQSVLTRPDQIDLASTSMALQLGQQNLSDTQLALLYSYIVLKKPIHTDAAADALFEKLPTQIDALGRNPTDTTKRLDPDQVIQFVAAKTFLKNIADRNSAFKAMAANAAEQLVAKPATTPTTSAAASLGPNTESTTAEPETTGQKTTLPEVRPASSNWSTPSVRVKR
jgi:hypothetical protein